MRTVLVVEDEPLIRLAAVMLVEEAGFAALEASQCRSGHCDPRDPTRRASRVHRYRYAWLDDGIRLAHYIRERWPPAQLIVASGKAIVGEVSSPWVPASFPSHTQTVR
jgi:hypothetical protein